jgi:hypothetical protein
LYHDVDFEQRDRFRNIQVIVLKKISLVVLGIILFISLFIFGAAFTVNSTVLDAGFLPNQLDRLPVAALLEETINNNDTGLSVEMNQTVMRTVKNLEPQVKAQIRAANAKVYAYLLGQQRDIDLKQVLRDTVLSEAFITTILNEPDVLSLVRQDLRDEIAGLVPSPQRQLIVYLDQAMPSLDPWLKEQIDTAAGPVIDYILGDAASLNITIPLSQMKLTLKASIKEAFLKSPPPELAGASQEQQEVVFEQYYGEFAAQIPATASIDSASLGIASPVSWEEPLTEAKSALTEARKFIGYFRMGLLIMAIFVLVLAAGIILIYREVKGAVRELGIICLAYGALTYLGIIIGGYFAGASVNTAEIPETLRTWLPGVYSAFFRPLEILSIVMVGLGIILIVLAVIYRRHPAPGAPPG